MSDDVVSGRRPDGMSAEEAIVYDFTHELLQARRVSDATYARAESRFGRAGVVDIAGIAGYYTLLAMELNLARYPVKADAPHLPRFPE